MHHSRVRSLILASTALLASACGSADGNDRDAFTVRDSAGVRIAESAAPAWRDGEAWRLSEEPVLEIGMLDGPPAYQFGQITGVTRTSSGDVIVADGQAKDVRWFGPDGRHLRSAGREGGGPGEFKALSRPVRLRGDSVAVFDWSNGRLTVFAPDGTLAGELAVDVEPGSGFPFPTGALSDGSVIFSRSPAFMTGGPTGPVRNPMTVLRLTRPENEWSEVATAPGRESFVTGTGNQISVQSPPFGRSSTVTAAGDSYWIGTTDRYELTRHRADGTVTLVVRRPIPNRQVTPGDVNSLFEQRLAWHTDEARRTEQERTLRSMPLPETMPAFAEVRAAGDDHLWVREYAVELDAPGAWSVFDDNGRFLGSVTTPARFNVHEFGSDYVLGVWTDDLDVPYVQMYRIEKAGR
jgi:hypothetical protein